MGIKLYANMEARKLAVKLYPQNMEEVLIERFGKDRVEQSYKFENWLDKLPVEESKSYFEDKIRQLLPNYDDINHFRENGFGRFNKETYDLILADRKSGIGSTADSELVAKIAIAMNIREKVKGFDWN